MTDPAEKYKAQEDDEYLTREVVDTCARTFRLYSNEGDERKVDCDSMEEFMNVLEFVRNNTDEDLLSYSDPL